MHKPCLVLNNLVLGIWVGNIVLVLGKYMMIRYFDP